MTAKPVFRIVIISPANYRHSAAFVEVAESLHYGIRACGYSVSTGYNDFVPGAVHIILGSNLMPRQGIKDLPPGTILYNLEQLADDSPWVNNGLANLFQRYETWDYSKRNLEHLKKYGCEGTYVPIGVVPELSRIQPAVEQDIDVLFYGSGNQRRVDLLNKLREKGLNVVHAFGVYGAERDALIARAKLVINIHLYETQIFEIVRVSYLLANHKAVVADADPASSELPAGIENAIALAPYDELPELCVELVRDADKRAALEDRGYRWVSRLKAAEILAPHLKRIADRWKAPAYLPAPARLRLGSPDRLDNESLSLGEHISCDVRWSPEDAIPLGAQFHTARFGPVILTERSFSHIDVGDLPTRVPDLNTFMLDCARLLRPGGQLQMSFPHELSGEAWLDPRARRALNENCWQMYFDANVTLGWGDCAFDVLRCDLPLTDVGKALQAEGADMNVLLRTPRAVRTMSVVLLKRWLGKLPT